MMAAFPLISLALMAQVSVVHHHPRLEHNLERLREGFVDFEKLQIVRKLLQLREDQEAREGMRKLEGILDRFAHENVQLEPAADTLNDARNLLSELTEIVLED
jgi:hypothetical protein